MGIMLYAFTSVVTENIYFSWGILKLSSEFGNSYARLHSCWKCIHSNLLRERKWKKTFVILKPKARNKCILLGWLMCIEGRVMLHDRRLGASGERNTESRGRANQKVTLPVTNPKVSNCLFWLAAWRQSEHSDWLQSKGVLIEIYCFR